MINKKHIESIPLKGDIKFREKTIESENNKKIDPTVGSKINAEIIGKFII